MEVTGANEAYIALLKRLVQSDRDAVMKAAKKLQKAAAKAGQEQTREAALQILLAAEEPAKVSKMVIAAMKDPSKNYRNAALSYASGFADKELYIELMKLVPKAIPDLKIDILNWFGRVAK